MTSNTSFNFGGGGGLTSAIQPSVNFGGSTGGSTGGFNFGGGTTGTTGGFGTSTTTTGGFGGSTGGGFGFGTPSGNTTSGTTGFGFGTPSANTGFGSTTTGTTNGGFNFGGTSTGTTGGTTGGFNFGNTNTAFGNTGGTTTGGTSGTGMFNFGGTTTQPTNNFMGGFGSSFGPQQPQRNHTEAAIQQVWDQYNPKLPACKFLHWFYNLPREENEKGEKLTRPLTLEEERTLLLREWQNIIPPDAWHEGQYKKNPDHRKYYAVPARSFGDVRARLTAQQDRTEKMIQTLRYASNKLDKLYQQEMKKQLAIERVRSEQARLVMRVLRVNKKLEVLMQKGQPLNNEDVALRNILSSLLRELHKPSQYRGRLNELKPQLNHYLNQPCMTIDEKSVGDEEVMKELQSFLLLQTQGLAQLVDIVKRDQQDVEYIGKQLDQLLMIMRK